MMSFATNHRSTIDSEVYKWVVQQLKKKKVVTPNAIRQKAFEIGQEFDPNFKASINWYNNWKKRFDYNESPEAEALKHKKRSYTAAFKLHAVQRAMELESASQASLELDVSRRCLQRWKEELDVIASVAEHSSNAVYRRPGQGRKVRDSGLDTQLLDWVKECWKQGINLSSGMIREKARELSPQPEFKASLGWFVKWQKRHCVDLKEQTCNPMAEEVMTPLKLRLLPEGEVSAYSAPKKRRLSKKRALNYDNSALLENDEEFDRLLLTWLVERWEAGDIVNDKMLKERAMELTANPDFKASKVWLTAWKGKYNVSLENQTYGTEGDEENEEIVEETPVYDEQVVIESDQQQQQTSDNMQPPQQLPATSEGTLTPAKEEAATALASLSADDHEIAEALQKLASAFGITTSSGSGSGGGGGPSRTNVTQLAALQQNDNAEFLLEGAGQVAVEEVVSEEVVTDEPMVVIEGTEQSAPPTESVTTSSEDIASSTVQSIVDVVSAATQIAQSITGSNNPTVTQPVAESLIQAVANQLNQSGSSGYSPTGVAQIDSESQISVTSTPPLTFTTTPSQDSTTPTPLTISSIPTPVTNLTISTTPAPAPLTHVTITSSPASLLTLTTSSTIPTVPPAPVTASSRSSLLSAVSVGTVDSHTSMSYVTEEVIISEPVVDSEQVEVLVEGDSEEVVVRGDGEEVVVRGDGEEVVVRGEEVVVVRGEDGTVVVEGEGGEVMVECEEREGTILHPTSIKDVHSVEGGVVMGEVVEGEGVIGEDDNLLGVDIHSIATSSVSNSEQVGSEVIITSTGIGGVAIANLIPSATTEIVTMATGEGTELVVTLGDDIPIPATGADILDIVQETIVGEGGGEVEDGGGEGERAERVYEEDFKRRVMKKALKLGSIQLAAREFSIPWKVVASWNIGE